MNVFLDMLGCRLNEAELQSWSRGFSRQGHALVADAEDAQLLVVNTCAVTAEAARKSRQLVRRLRRRNPAAHLVVTGCEAELDPAGTLARDGIDLVVANRRKARLVEEVLSRFPAPPGPASAHAIGPGRTRAFVKVQDGCRHRCTYCIVTIARGEERSRPIPEIVGEIEEITAGGQREVVLTGVHLGGYGHDLGTDLDTLVGAILADTGVPRLRLSSIEPWDLTARLLRRWRDRRLLPHLHLPIQAGSDAVLRRMGRRTRVSAFSELACRARAAISDLTLTTDVIVGFPGESDGDFEKGLETIASIGFGHIHAFPFSAREGTRAATMPGTVDGETIRARMQRLMTLGSQMKRAHLARFTGSERAVLWERPERELPAGRVWSGYTDNYLRTEAVAARGESLRNAIERVRIVDAGDDRLTARRLS